jgi:hypothetical protein
MKISPSAVIGRTPQQEGLEKGRSSCIPFATEAFDGFIQLTCLEASSTTQLYWLRQNACID